MSRFDEPRNYYVFKYIVDSVSGEPTEHAGEIQAFVKATDPWNAVEVAGFDDLNKYGANEVEDLGSFEKAIKEERSLLTKISKQLKEMTDEAKADRDTFLKDRPCPNNCGKLDKNFSCPKCGFGHEAEELAKELDRLIKEEKKKGEDVSELEAIRDSINQTDMDDYSKSHDEDGNKLG